MMGCVECASWNARCRPGRVVWGTSWGEQVELEGPDWQFEGGGARRCDGLGLVMLRPVVSRLSSGV